MGMVPKIVRRVFAEALPFVARSPEMKVEWLRGVHGRGTLTCAEVAPYMHLLLTEFRQERDEVEYGGAEHPLRAMFRGLDPDMVSWMVRCTEIYDVPVLLDLIDELQVDDAVQVLRKTPPPYEKKALYLLDQVFQAVHHCGGPEIVDRAAAKMREQGTIPPHFDAACERFKEILIDEKILAELYPQAHE